MPMIACCLLPYGTVGGGFLFFLVDIVFVNV